MHFFEGNYQIKQAKGYIFEHLKPSILDEEEFEFIVELCATHKDLVRVRLASRHSSSKMYVATVQFTDDDVEEPIQGWFCTCSAGARVLGCCAHITALIWHLGVCRAEVDSTEHPLSASQLLLSVDDCIQYSDTEESGDDQSDSDNSTDDQALWMRDDVWELKIHPHISIKLSVDLGKYFWPEKWRTGMIRGF